MNSKNSVPLLENPLLKSNKIFIFFYFKFLKRKLELNIFQVQEGKKNAVLSENKVLKNKKSYVSFLRINP